LALKKPNFVSSWMIVLLFPSSWRGPIIRYLIGGADMPACLVVSMFELLLRLGLLARLFGFHPWQFLALILSVPFFWFGSSGGQNLVP